MEGEVESGTVTRYGIRQRDRDQRGVDVVASCRDKDEIGVGIGGCGRGRRAEELLLSGERRG